MTVPLEYEENGVVECLGLERLLKLTQVYYLAPFFCAIVCFILAKLAVFPATAEMLCTLLIALRKLPRLGLSFFCLGPRF